MKKEGNCKCTLQIIARLKFRIYNFRKHVAKEVIIQFRNVFGLPLLVWKTSLYSNTSRGVHAKVAPTELRAYKQLQLHLVVVLMVMSKLNVSVIPAT